MNCINCFHYNACSSVDMTGYVTDVEHVDDPCEHFITPEEVHPTATIVEKIEYGNYIDKVFLNYHCSRCDERLYIKSYDRKDWDEYFAANRQTAAVISYEHCPRCGSLIVKEEENA